MRTVSKQDAREWCQEQGVSLNENGLPDVRQSLGASEFCIPNDAGKRTALVKEQMRKLLTGSSCLVWLNDWQVWPSGQWQHLFDRFRLSYGCRDPLIEKPAHVIEEAEYDAAISIAVYSVLMLWDCYVITDNGSWLYYSHDGFGLARP